MLLSPKDCLGECVVAFGETAGRVFYDPRYQEIYTVLVEMWDEPTLIDVITVQERLRNKNLLDQIGGAQFLAELQDKVPSAANLGYYVALVKEKFLLRSMVRTLAECGGRIYEELPEGAGVEELLDTIEADVLKVNSGFGAEAMVPIKTRVHTLVDRIDDIRRGVGMISGIRTHFGYFDKMTGGLHYREAVVIAARPSMGKTSLAMNIAWNVATLERLPVGVFSLEMSGDDLTFRLMCAAAEVNFHQIRTGFIADADYGKLAEAAPKVARAPIHIDDEAALSILKLRAKARRMVQQYGVKLIVIDYLQLMNSTNPKCKDRQGEIADISGGLKAMAKELNVAVIILSQLNRDIEKNKNRKPQLADLRESGAIEQDADLALLLYKPKGENEDENDDDIAVNGLIAKQRNGPTGDVEFRFWRWCMKYVDAYANRGKERMPSNAELGISGAAKGEQ